jgi:hypothetical protein
VGEVLNRSVRIHGIDVGEPVDVLLDPDLRCVLGLEVHCRDGVNRFLPWLAGELQPDELLVELPVALLDGPQLEYYREHALALNALRRLPVAGFDTPAARVEDVVVDARGRVVALEIDARRRRRTIELDRVRVETDRVVVDATPVAGSKALA